MMKARLLFTSWIMVVVFGLLLTSATPAGSQNSPSFQFSSQEKGLGAEVQISTPTNPESDRYVPATAYNSTNGQTLVAWHRHVGDNYFIEGRLLNSAGVPLGSGPTIFKQGQTPVYQPAVAYNSYDHQYMVVWMNNTSLDGKTYAIWGMILNANLTIAHSEFEVFNPAANFSAWTPRIAFNPKVTEYQVVFNNLNVAGFPGIIYPDSIIEATLMWDGYLVGHIVVIFNTPGNMIYPSDVDLVYANENGSRGQYLWVWDQVKPGTADHDIWAANIDANLGGYLPGLPPFKVDDSPTDQIFPSIASNGNNRFMVVWQEKGATQWQDWDIRGREINQIGVAFGGTHIIHGYGDTDETNPFVAAWHGSSSRYVVGCERESATGKGIWLAYYNDGLNALPIDPYIFWLDTFPAADFSFWFNEYPTGVVTGSGVQMAYTGISDSPTDHRQIYSRTWSPARIFLPSVKK